MQDNKQYDNLNLMEDISSCSVKKITVNEPKVKTTKPLSRHLGTIIKIIAFIVAFFIIIISFALAFLLYTKEPLFLAISLAIIILGTLLSAVFLFVIYGIGHIITQNNEILEHIKN